MTRPTSYLIRMIVFLAIVLVVTILLAPQLATAFGANPVLNGLIVGVLLFGCAWTIAQVMSLKREVEWLEGFRGPKGSGIGEPKLLAPMASMLAARRSDRLSLSAMAMRSVLDGIIGRLDEKRELSRYMTGLLIFLGLLGTFWGLLLTIGAVADVIGSMSVGSGDVTQMFNQLKSGLARPLEGMGTAFSSSMLGLAGALVLGFLDLTAGQAQNRFTNDLEEWLAGITRLSSGVLGQEGEGSVPAYVQALLEQTAENLEEMQRILARGEDNRGKSNDAMQQLAERLAVLTELMRANQQVMVRVAEAQITLGPALQRLADSQAAGGMDEATRANLRNIEIYARRILEDSQQGRTQATQEIRTEIKILSRTIAALAEQPQP
ncbi:flagellar motor protein MotA [Plastoroseomonas arctica]|uniref:Coiled-coil domain-containing protein 22 n=1 Tax=Plastoroseomonas arctica TaxID=1509237 RepID=A0AAF1JXZ1_9PROT|nr:flagellar motor protein MotA [Plastoroseomonas arctica]MBR0656252.1 coiled-coil domain-containing protein 22 [Plastoroseomonas arctica]